MPIIEGYDDLDLGPKRFPEGEYQVTITEAKLVSGERKLSGSKWYALKVGFTGGGFSADTVVYYPADTAEWTSWSDGRRKLTKRQFDTLGIGMSQLESEGARAALIGKIITISVEKNGEYTNFYFREAAGMDSGVDFPAPTVPLEGAAVAPTAGHAEAIIV